MCSQLLLHQEKHGKFYNTTERWFQSLIAAYRRGLDRALHHRIYVIAEAVFVAGLSVVLALVLLGTLLSAPLPATATTATAQQPLGLSGVWRADGDEHVRWMRSSRAAGKTRRGLAQCRRIAIRH